MSLKSDISKIEKGKVLRLSHHVYVVELDRRIWTDSAKFRKENPHYRGIKECLYVGMTSQDPAIRFQKHITGHRNRKGHKVSSRIVEKYGKYLRPSLYANLNPMTKYRAALIERKLAERLRRQGYAVWWN